MSSFLVWFLLPCFFCLSSLVLFIPSCLSCLVFSAWSFPFVASVLIYLFLCPAIPIFQFLVCLLRVPPDYLKYIFGFSCFFFQVAEQTFENNAAVCTLHFTEQYASLYNCTLTRPWSMILSAKYIIYYTHHLLRSESTKPPMLNFHFSQYLGGNQTFHF